MDKQPARIDQVFVVSHTHWDREWYQDFQTYRARLVYLLDELLDTMERDADYRYFMLDGQTIIVDDYLEIRPEQRARFMDLIRQGRIRVGPWYVMPDEFLVSGEALIRNLLVGFRRARSWGVEPMKSGYVPDIFGHNSQLPQILRGFGIDNAVLFRGFGAARSAELWWDGADGSRVLGLKLDEDRSYANFYFFLRWPFTERDFVYDQTELIERARQMLRYGAERATTNLLLALDGVDHLEIEPQLPWMLRTLNAAPELGTRFVHTHLEAFLDELRPRIGDLPVYVGEQREPGDRGVNNLVLANVLSSRVHLKQHNARCETNLQNWAEPWAVFAALDGRPYPYAFLQKSWQWLLQNHPHDSICGCSIDQVHRDMLYRFDQSRLISEQMISEQLTYISNHLDTAQLNGDALLTIFNSSQSALVDAVVEAEIVVPPGTSFRLYDPAGREVRYQLLELTKNSVRRWRPYRDIPHGEPVDRRQIALRANVPAFGYATYVIRYVSSQGAAAGEYSAPKIAPPVRYPGTMQISEDTWDTGRVRVRLRTDGTLDLTDHATGRTYARLLQFEDEADIGEGWNYVSPATNETFLGPNSAQCSVIWNGPLHTRLCIRTILRISAAIAPDETRRSAALIDLPITTYVDLHKDDAIVRCRTIVENTARDHRLRLLLPTGLQTDQFYTSTPFDFVRRSIARPDYADYLETAQDVAPHNGIVALDDGQCGLALYSRGLYEVAVRDNGARTIALTLFRSTGKEVLTDGSDGGQLLGQLTFDYALRPFANDAAFPGHLWREQQQWVAGLRFVNRTLAPPLHETPHRRTADLPLTRSYLRVSAPELIVSAIKRAEDRPDHYIVRLLNITDRAVVGDLTFDRTIWTARLVNLDEQPITALAPRNATVTIQAAPKQIVTVEVVFPPDDAGADRAFDGLRMVLSERSEE